MLTTGWIEGEKLSQSTASDVGDLVNVGVICYLKQVWPYTPLLQCSHVCFNGMVFLFVNLYLHHIRKPVGPFLDMDQNDQEHIWKAIGVYWPCFICGCSHVKLLDTGLFHADPHPGNLIRTPEGKLAILDFGMCVEVALHACLPACLWVEFSRVINLHEVRMAIRFDFRPLLPHTCQDPLFTFCGMSHDRSHDTDH